MQRIANLLVVQDGQVLLLKKPRRNWYVAPGGKVEPEESIYDAAIREFTEETNAKPIQPHLKGIYTMVIEDGEVVKDEWMLFTFVANGLTGTPWEETREGLLEWHPIEHLESLPMAEGDRANLLFAVKESGTQYGTFHYTEEFQLLKQHLQSSSEGDVLNG
ncbi:8-oxo-dGTP diphosphatase [Paenisporosarcina cavernae]|uniref:8-oxo-dGTP diphosphatase n=1 Tax=Paenisporosarcina cavernae TaxID=2320858 RepID=A0A385YTB5_9BACL|nr:8-oxo-dGTP diphosphatase [Paenisporosarcina cavernae]AYC30115.1 8-oxo-dGTP diphosphatase [Paenisporosarcina cavernae]